MPMPSPLLLRGNLVLPHLVTPGALFIRDGRIVEFLRHKAPTPPGATLVDVADNYLSPGFIDLHVHGGGGGDFMDGTKEAFEAALRSHVRHGTTRVAATTTVARHDQIMQTLAMTRQFRLNPDPRGARVMGAHFYGPYFRYEARGAHPGADVRYPVEAEFSQYLDFAADLVTATVAPELPGAEEFVRACNHKGVRTNAGHSWATFAQMAAAVKWGVRHVDHLFCAMSDKAKLRQFQMYPMQGGVMEATLYFDELTTEVIADGKHLDASLLKLALKIKGPDRLALVSDCSRALDMPDGEYKIGALDGGEPLVKRDNVGQTPDGKALASSVVGLDECVRTFADLTGRPLWEVIRMATLTPAKIAGKEKELGSLEKNKLADILVLDKELNVKQVFIEGEEVAI